MKITEGQLRKIIREEVASLSEAPRARRPMLGDIYMNPQRHQISIEFLEGGNAGWELLARGKAKSMDGTLADLQQALEAGGFVFSRNEQAY